MNTGYVHSSGALMLEPMGQQLIITVTKRGGAEPINITSTTPAAAVTSTSRDAYMAPHDYMLAGPKVHSRSLAHRSSCGR